VSIPECIRALIHRDPLTLVNSDRVSQQLNTPQLESRSTFALTMALKAARHGCSESRVATSDRDARAFACTCDIVDIVIESRLDSVLTITEIIIAL
jgi:hypothetical protein